MLTCLNPIFRISSHVPVIVMFTVEEQIAGLRLMLVTGAD